MLLLADLAVPPPPGGVSVTMATIVGVEAHEFPKDETPLVDEGETDLHPLLSTTMFADDDKAEEVPVPNWGKTADGDPPDPPLDVFDIMDGDDDTEEEVGEADLYVGEVELLEALNDDAEMGGNEDSKLDDEDSHIIPPSTACNGTMHELMVDTSPDDADGVVIVNDNFKFEAVKGKVSFADEAVWCDKSVGSANKKAQIIKLAHFLS